MTVKRHAILLTTGIVVLVFLCLAFANVVGCKDKVEAKELDDTDFILWPDPVFLRVELKEEPTFEDGETRIYLYKGDDFDVVIEKKEPNESRAGILEIGTGIWTCTVCGKINHNYKEIIEHLCKVPEPNEPLLKIESDATDRMLKVIAPTILVDWIYIADPNEPQKVSLDFIPTWPDYIELEKNLVIDQKCVAPDGIHFEFYKYIFGKGTKIYFKD